MYDVVVIGSGPAGYVAAIRASQLGLKTICVEESINEDGKLNLGGTCLNVGCIPSKALLDSSHRFYEANKNLAEHGIDIKDMKLNLSAMMKRKDEIVTKLTGGITGLFSANKVESISGRGKVLSKSQVEVVKSDGAVEVIDAKNIIIASGSSPIEIPAAKFGENIVDSTGALSFEKVPKSLGIVGAGIIGLELGSVWSRLGSKVTVIEAMDTFLPMADPDIAKDSMKEFKKQGLDIKLNSKLTAAKELKNSVKVTYNDSGNNVEAEFDKLIVAVGRKPNSSNVLSEKLDIKLNNGFIEVDKFCQTSVDSIWAIGDVVRGPMLAHKASEEGLMVVERIFGKDTCLNYDHIPNVIYTHPEIAWVGVNEQQLKEKGQDYKVGSFPFLASGRALASGETAGSVQVISENDTDRILGIQVFGPSASEILQQGLIAMDNGVTSKGLSKTIFSHPTVSEALLEATLAMNGEAIHIQNRKKK